MFKGLFLGAILIVLPVLWGSSLAAQVPLDVRDFAKLPTLRNPAISPDGQYLALSVHNNDAKWGEPDYQLVVFHLPDLKGVSKLNMAPFYQPANIVWLSNTRLALELAYKTGSLEQPGGTGEVIALDYDGSHKQTLYSDRQRGSADSGAHSMDMPAGAASIEAVPYPRNGHVYLNLAVWPDRYNSDDRKPDHSEIYDVDSATGKAVQIGKMDRDDMTFVIHDGVARIAYGTLDNGRTIDVFVRADASQAWKRLEDAVTGKQMTPIRISRDGTKLWSSYGDAYGPEKLIESDLEGGNRKVLAQDEFSAFSYALWNEATGEPYAAVFDTERPHIVYLDQSLQAKALKALNDKYPDHLVTFRGMDANATRLLVVAYSDRDPGTIGLLDTQGMSMRPLYQVEDWIHPEQMAVRKPFRFKASDGMELAGFMTIPNGVDPRNLPTVLLPHGGPIGPADEWSYDPDAQFLANNGYLVVQINYRGSGGRGSGFEYAGYRQFGTRIQQDLLDGLSWAIAGGYADGKRVCVYGGSFGGYSSLMLPILAPDQFKCAIDYAGVSDWTINMKTSDTSHVATGRSYFDEAIGDVEAAKAISPLYHLDTFKVPVLIAHGEDDKRVPIENAKAVRSALARDKKPYEWLSKPKEGHGFYNEDNRADMYTHMRAFLAKYLGN